MLVSLPLFTSFQSHERILKYFLKMISVAIFSIIMNSYMQ